MKHLMNSLLPASVPAGRRLTALAAVLAALCASNVCAQAPVATAVTPAESTRDEAAAAQLEKLVAPIALYPDDLVAIVLPASTNPVQVVQAERFLDKRRADPKLAVDEKWDDAVKALLNYPEIVKTMSGDLDWTTALGEAVVKDQGEVLEAVQVFRRKVQAAGNLKTDAKQVVVVEKEVIKIVPADPQVIYVPQYNPTTVVVYGSYSSWGYWPSPYPVYYYPYAPGAAFAAGVIWGAAIGAAWHGDHYVAHYGGYGGHNNINVNVGNVNVNRPGAGQRPGGDTAWQPNKRPGQVSSSAGRAPPSRVGDDRAGGAGAGRASPTPGAGAARSTAARPAAQPAAANRAGGAGAGAFDGYGSGRQTQLNSSRGSASRGAMAGGDRGGRGGRGGRR